MHTLLSLFIVYRYIHIYMLHNSINIYILIKNNNIISLYIYIHYLFIDIFTLYVYIYICHDRNTSPNWVILQWLPRSVRCGSHCPWPKTLQGETRRWGKLNGDSLVIGSRDDLLETHLGRIVSDIFDHFSWNGILD